MNRIQLTSQIRFLKLGKNSNRFYHLNSVLNDLHFKQDRSQHNRVGFQNSKNLWNDKSSNMRRKKNRRSMTERNASIDEIIRNHKFWSLQIISKLATLRNLEIEVMNSALVLNLLRVILTSDYWDEHVFSVTSCKSHPIFK